jgi:MFS superfamily sulfate permease-like transporter
MHFFGCSLASNGFDLVLPRLVDTFASMNSQTPPSGFTFKYIKDDLPAGLVVFLVALPLCLGIALASGAPLFSGIIAGIVGGIVVAFVSGSSLSVSGPAAGLTVIVFNGIAQVGSYPAFLLAVVIAGLLQIALGYLKAGTIGYYFPSSVIKGMLASIGIILLIKQTPVAIGYTKGADTIFNAGALTISVISLLIMIVWELRAVKKITLFKWIPGALVAVIMGTLLNGYFMSAKPEWALGEHMLVKLPVASSASDFIGQFTLPDFAALSNYNVYVLAFTIAIIASLETLLCIEAADKLDPHKRITPTNRELKAQGIGNLISGLIGGLPLTAVIVRTSANVNADGKTKLSAIIHGVFLTASVVGLASLLNKIPLACLAAVLLVVGYKLTKVSLFKSMYKLGWEQFLPFIITIVAVQFSDLLKGIALGMLVSFFYILRANYRRDYHIHQDKKEEGSRYTIRLAENVTFINKGSILRKLSEIPEGSSVHIDGSGTHYIDLDVLEIVHNFKEMASLKNIQLELTKIPDFPGTAAH